ncbi:putative L-ascorbate peroxidase 6 [Selaginella moellendorffii]|nr:putative L-ascorbate peroxidase 6 [Selaginella moellendorffii]|eukprot:XP_002960262.2 putative L-ascorbate peroxidase 6 [Selaginella moellendorffii]
MAMLLGWTSSVGALPKIDGGRCASCDCRDEARSPVVTRRFALISSSSAALLSSKFALAVSEDAKDSRIREALRKVVSKQKAPGLLRLVFHDAGTFSASKGGGMNGSIIYELERPENAGLERSIKVLNKARGELEGSLHVSWADLIAVAGSEAIVICGGPFIPVKLGRLDSSVADIQGELPSEDLNAVALKKIFQSKGFSTQEMVALSGAHTLGSKGFGNPTVFDNSYYDVLLKMPWSDPDNKMASMIGLPSDRVLVSDKECLPWIQVYKRDQSKFYTDFTLAYTKLVNLGAQWEG